MKKHVKKIKSLLKKKRHHIGYTTSAVLFLSMGALLAQNDSVPFAEPGGEPVIKEAEVYPEDIVDPREIENALREIGRLKTEARGLLKRVSKLQNAELKQRLTGIVSELDAFAGNIKNSSGDYTAREALMEFYDARMWEEVGVIRAQIELPKILKEIPLSIRRIDKLLKLKAYKTLGIDIQGITNYLTELKSSHAEADRLYKAGDIEGAMEELRFIEEGGHPGELEGAIRRIKEISDLIKRVQDKQIQKELFDMLSPITEAINDGDFRVAHEILNEVHPLVMDVVRRSYKASAKTRTDILKRLSDFEGKVNSKLEGWEAQERMKEEQMRVEFELKEMTQKQEQMPPIQVEPVQIQPVPSPSTTENTPPPQDAGVTTTLPQ